MPEILGMRNVTPAAEQRHIDGEGNGPQRYAPPPKIEQPTFPGSSDATMSSPQEKKSFQLQFEGEGDVSVDDFSKLNHLGNFRTSQAGMETGTFLPNMRAISSQLGDISTDQLGHLFTAYRQSVNNHDQSTKTANRGGIEDAWASKLARDKYLDDQKTRHTDEDRQWLDYEKDGTTPSTGLKYLGKLLFSLLGGRSLQRFATGTGPKTFEDQMLNELQRRKKTATGDQLSQINTLMQNVRNAQNFDDSTKQPGKAIVGRYTQLP